MPPDDDFRAGEAVRHVPTGHLMTVEEVYPPLFCYR
jgi:hypothetical protein